MTTDTENPSEFIKSKLELSPQQSSQPSKLKLADILKSDKIQAIIPIYLPDKGDCIKILTSNQEIIRQQTVQSCIESIASYYNLNLKYLRKNYGKELNITKKVPIVINDELIYISILLRKPICKGDSASGYIELNSISDIINKDGKALIKIKNQKLIQTLQSELTLRKTMVLANYAKFIYLNKNYGLI